MLQRTIVRNAIRCAHCGVETESRTSFHCARHTCDARKSAGGPDACIAADGGREYLRRIGRSADWFEASITEPPIDWTEAAALRERRIRYEAQLERDVDAATRGD
jgi:hypothetical protein